MLKKGNVIIDLKNIKEERSFGGQIAF